MESTPSATTGDELPWNLPLDELLRRLNAKLGGLADRDAKQRLAEYGPNDALVHRWLRRFFMNLNEIRLELARDHDFPDGSPERGYEFTAPLGEDGRISEGDGKTNRNRCRVLRFWNGEPDEVGHLVLGVPLR